MAGRFLPQRDVNLITRVSRELVGDKQNSKDGLINQEVVIYKPSLQESSVNMYGEAADGKKVYKNGVQMAALVTAEDFDSAIDEIEKINLSKFALKLISAGVEIDELELRKISF